ncbi:hypothetical protein [Yoonia sp. 208BN28-4]|uniref:hypothetical protein n=1 Tax=Yoonia sp. 208BN28-4 TaxID=3126505 RepID=UPI0030AFB89C
MHSNAQMESFNQRIKRINNPRNTHYVDAETGMKIPKRLSKDMIAKASSKPSAIALLMALVVGTLGLMAARLARYTVLEMPETNDTTLMVELAIAGIVAFIVGAMINQKTMPHMIAHIAGAAFMAVAMHNLVWMFPAEFAAYYSPDYVSHVQSNTAPMSLYLRGQTYTI